MNKPTRQQYEKRWGALKNERNARWFQWRELSDHVFPWRARFLLTDRNKAQRNDKIINSAPAEAVRTSSAGIMSGLTSKSRPWFRYTLPDVESTSGAARAWINHAEREVYEVLAKSNLYNCLHTLYIDLLVFGTAALILEEDERDVVRGYNCPIGSFALASNARREVDTIYREVPLTVCQMVERFGRDACSDRVKTAYDRGDLETVFDVLHVIEPNKDYDEGALGPRGKRFRSCWFETGVGEHAGFLREAGYDYFPVLCPRWDVIGEDVYGTSPAMAALGDCRALQALEKEKARLVDLMGDPPYIGPPDAARTFSGLPGSFTAVSGADSNRKIEPAIVISGQQLAAVREAITDHVRRIQSALFSDLWLANLELDRRQITAEEIRARQQEQMMQLGPMLERQDTELLTPLTEITFTLAVAAGRIQPAPEEMQGLEYKVEYVSILAQAQKLLGTTQLERSLTFSKAVAEIRPEVLDTKDWDEIVRQYDDMLGTPPQLTRSAERVQAVRQERARQQQAQQQQQQMLAAAQGAQQLSQADLSGNNALSQMLSAFGAPQPGGVA